jgi:hypothetical protein
MRDIIHVIDSIVARTPSEEYRFLEVAQAIKNTACYTPPEAMPGLYGALSSAIMRAIGYPPKVDWHWEVLCIFMDKPIGELKERFK